ncbi:MAG TPA: hypothetical protein VF784_15990 [Anaerolineales bacterium]
MTSPPLPALVPCYWVVPGRLLAGEYPAHLELPHAAARLDALLGAGINTFCDLTAPGELTSYLPLLEERGRRLGVHVAYQVFPMQDRSIPDRVVMRSLLDALDTAISAGRNVYLHCWGGVGRTGMAVGCYLVRHGHTGREALDQIAAWWQTDPRRFDHPQSPETAEQARFVLDWPEATQAGGP